MTESKVVCDTGPVIHLDELDCIDLLADFQEIIIPSKVSEEIKRHRPLALERSELSFRILSENIYADESLLTFCRTLSLDIAEAEALALVKKNPQAILLTDDAAARLVAEQMGFKVHGTIGILVRSIRRGSRKPSEILQILDEIQVKSTLYIKHSLLEEIISRIKKEYQL